MSTAHEYLSKAACFRGLDPAFLERLAACAEPMSWQADHYLFQQNGSADAFYLITAGQVALEVFTSRCLRIRLETLRAGELLGWSWLYPPYLWHFDALALGPVEALRFDARQVRALCESDHSFGYRLQQRFTPLIIARLQSTRMQLAEFYSGQEAGL